MADFCFLETLKSVLGSSIMYYYLGTLTLQALWHYVVLETTKALEDT